MRLAISSVAMWLLCPAVYSQVSLSQEGAGPVPPGQCVDGVTHDDGSVEAGLGIFPNTSLTRFVEPFDASEVPDYLATVCVCLIADLDFSGPDRELVFNIVFLDDDGPGGSPGSLLASVPALATEIPLDLPGAIYSVDVSDATMGALPSSGTVFIGVEWNPLAEGAVFFVCSDRDQPPHGGFVMAEGLFDWSRIEDIFPIHYGSMVIRAKGWKPSVIEIPTLSFGGIVALMLTLGLLGWRRVAGR